MSKVASGSKADKHAGTSMVIITVNFSSKIPSFMTHGLLMSVPHHARPLNPVDYTLGIISTCFVEFIHTWKAPENNRGLLVPESKFRKYGGWRAVLPSAFETKPRIWSCANMWWEDCGNHPGLAHPECPWLWNLLEESYSQQLPASDASSVALYTELAAVDVTNQSRNKRWTFRKSPQVTAIARDFFISSKVSRKRDVE